jgi:hypothetical protein
MPAASPDSTMSRSSAWSTTHPTPGGAPAAPALVRGPPQADPRVLWLRKKQDPGSLQGPGPDYAAPPKPPPQQPSSTT